MFNAKEYVAAQTPPTFIDIDGQEHQGRILSLPQMAPFLARFDTFADGELPWDDVQQLVRDFCDAIGVPAEKVLALPIGGVAEALADFFACQPMRMRGKTPAAATPPAMPGSD